MILRLPVSNFGISLKPLPRRKERCKPPHYKRKKLIKYQIELALNFRFQFVFISEEEFIAPKHSSSSEIKLNRKWRQSIH